MFMSEQREKVWLGNEGQGHLDLSRMKQAGFAGGLFAIFVPPISGGPPPDFAALMANPPYDLPMPPQMTHAEALPMAMTMAGLLHWMERTAPLVATHSNAFALSESPRNLTDQQLAQIRETGGMVGFNYATFYINKDGTAANDMGWEPLIRHMDHLIEHLGEDHVGLGSDFDGCIVPKLIGDVTGVPSFITALGEHGYDQRLLAKLARENWLDCLERGLGQ